MNHPLRHLRVTLTLLLIATPLTTAMANPALDDETPAVRTSVEALNAALVDADPGALESLTAPELSYGHSSGKVQDRAAFLADVAGNTFDFRRIHVSDESITIVGNVAVVRHLFSAEYVNNGVAGELKIGNLLLWQKQAGKWRLVARQAYRL